MESQIFCHSQAIMFRAITIWTLARFMLTAGWFDNFNLKYSCEAGALMSYGPSYADHCRQAANYVDQILKGAKPADLPVQLPTEFELTVNSKTAKALGLTIPSSIVLSANIVE
jgi:ABC transporter substrate binding protein